MASVVEKSLEWGVQADQAVVQRLFDIMDRVEENLDIAVSMERDAERNREEDFRELASKIKNQGLMYSREIGQLQVEIGVLNDRIAMNDQKMDDAHTKQHDFEERLEDRLLVCESDQGIWE
jgi:predicted  nucleic acid-binding Zn-ribbon protein